MRAHLGGQPVVESPATGATGRDGEIVGLHRQDGTPPHDVRWSDTSGVTLVFPGSGAHIRHVQHARPGITHGTHHPYTAETETASAAAPPTRTPGPGDIGRRVAAERRRPRLSRAETARRARVPSGCLAYLEDRAANPGSAAPTRPADALKTTVGALRGEGTGLPPGQGRALPHPQPTDLSLDECRRMLSTHGVGRIAVPASDGRPAVVPVSYEVAGDAIVFRTAPESVPAEAVGKEVAFEVDHVDEALSQGWSVLAVGTAGLVTKPDAVRMLSQRAHGTPRAGGERGMWVSVRPASPTGRRITPAGR